MPIQPTVNGASAARAPRTRVAPQIDRRRNDLDAPRAGAARTLCEVVVAGDDDRRVAHDRIDLVAEQSPHRARWVLIVAVKNRVVVVDDQRRSGRATNARRRAGNHGNASFSSQIASNEPTEARNDARCAYARSTRRQSSCDPRTDRRGTRRRTDESMRNSMPRRDEFVEVLQRPQPAARAFVRVSRQYEDARHPRRACRIHATAPYALPHFGQLRVLEPCASASSVRSSGSTVSDVAQTAAFDTSAEVLGRELQPASDGIEEARGLDRSRRAAADVMRFGLAHVQTLAAGSTYARRQIEVLQIDEEPLVETVQDVRTRRGESGRTRR